MEEMKRFKKLDSKKYKNHTTVFEEVAQYVYSLGYMPDILENGNLDVFPIASRGVVVGFITEKSLLDNDSDKTIPVIYISEMVSMARVYTDFVQRFLQKYPETPVFIQGIELNTHSKVVSNFNKNILKSTVNYKEWLRNFTISNCEDF